MADYEFRYAPLTGRLTGKQMIEQTEQAINGLANLVDDAAGQVEIISTLANEANENAATALETAEEALATTGRTYLTVSIPADANDYYDSQLIYIADNTSTNIPVADTGMLETKTNDNKTACEQVFIADSSGASYYRHGDITAETVGDVTTYTVTWGGWSSEPASQTYVQGELANYAPLSDLENYLPLSGGTMTGEIKRSGNAIVCSANTGYINIFGGTDNTSPYITLYGKSHSSYAGRITLRTGDGTNNPAMLLYPNGTATWDGSNIVTDSTVHNLLVVETKTSSSATISANGTNTFSISVSKSGYTPIGIVGFSVNGSGKSRAGIFGCSLSSTTVSIEVWNQSTGSVTWTASVSVLYVKNSI